MRRSAAGEVGQRLTSVLTGLAPVPVLHLGLSCKVLHREAKISLTQDYSLLKFPGSRSRVNPLVRLPQQELPAGHTEFFAPGGHLKGVLVTRDKERYIEVWDLARQSLLVGKKVTKEVGRFIADGQSSTARFLWSSRSADVRVRSDP